MGMRLIYHAAMTGVDPVIPVSGATSGSLSGSGSRTAPGRDANRSRMAPPGPSYRRT